MIDGQIGKQRTGCGQDVSQKESVDFQRGEGNADAVVLFLPGTEDAHQGQEAREKAEQGEGRWGFAEAELTDQEPVEETTKHKELNHRASPDDRLIDAWGSG